MVDSLKALTSFHRVTTEFENSRPCRLAANDTKRSIDLVKRTRAQRHKEGKVGRLAFSALIDYQAARSPT
ncbi:hypothetical protein OUZ56_005156 [Daphnia magna]|uniref:Uncharacterized protein n=1 Tax=Daphnia magna TaxID=35525 RepID=A0ABQ9YRZ4_9CRUS|nr:hypothetical protein OUZ56_005156 [Daphnia magna]